MDEIEEKINKLSKRDKEFLKSLKIRNESEKVKNPFTGEIRILSPLAAALYYVIKGAELLGDYNVMRQGLGIFVTLWSEDYYVLLD